MREPKVTLAPGKGASESSGQKVVDFVDFSPSRKSPKSPTLCPSDSSLRWVTLAPALKVVPGASRRMPILGVSNASNQFAAESIMHYDVVEGEVVDFVNFRLRENLQNLPLHFYYISNLRRGVSGADRPWQRSLRMIWPKSCQFCQFSPSRKFPKFPTLGPVHSSLRWVRGEPLACFEGVSRRLRRRMPD